MSDPDDPAAWMGKADEDLLCIDNNLAAARVPWELVAYHAQQAAEKALKALLVRHRQDVPFTHDLVRLLNQCAGVAPTLAAHGAACRELNRCALPSRYPGDAPGVTEDEARDVVGKARRIVDEIRPLLSDP